MKNTRLSSKFKSVGSTVFIPAIFITSVLSGCSDSTPAKSPAKAAEAAASAATLIPNDCNFVWTGNLGAKSAVELSETALFKLQRSADGGSEIVSQLKSQGVVADKDSPTFKALEKISSSSLFSEPYKFFGDSAVCFKVKSDDKQDLLVVYSVTGGQSLNKELGAAEADLRTAGLKVSRTDDSKGLVLSIDVGDQTAAGDGSKSTSETAHIIFGNNRLVISNDLAQAQRASTGFSAAESFAANADFVTRSKLIPATEGELGRMYATGNLVTALKGAETVEANAAQLDRSYVIGAATYEGTRESGRLAFNAFASPSGDPAGTEQLKELAAAPGIVGLDSGALRSVLSLSFAAQPLLTSISKNSPEAAAELKNLPQVSELLFGIALPSAASPFPDLYLSLATPDPELVLSTLKVLLDRQQMLANWQTQTIAGTEVQLALSPLGVGAFLAKQTDRVLLATSKGAIEQLLGKNSAKPVKLPNGVMFRAQTNGQQIVELTKALQGTLAMFTGGQANVGLEKLQALEQVGDGSLTIKVETEGVRVEGELAVVGKKA